MRHARSACSKLLRVRGFVLGLILVVALMLTVLSRRPGGFRRQLRLVGRRLKVFLWLGGIYIAGSMVIRLVFPSGPVADYGPPALAILLVAVFVVVGQDPASTPSESPPGSRAP